MAGGEQLSAAHVTFDVVGEHGVEDVVRRQPVLVDLAEYKRRQYPPGPKISPKNFGRDRRLPITNAWRETT